MPLYTPLKQHWLLDEKTVFLNHGSFGACPIPVLAQQRLFQDQMEQQPVQFLTRTLESALWKAKVELASFIGADANDLIWVPNATHGISTVLHNIPFSASDELITTNHAYGACLHALTQTCERSGCRLVVVNIPFPISHSDQITDAIMAAVSPQTRLVVIDHITSPTGLIFPVQQIVAALQQAGIDCLVDGAHAPGQIPIDLASLQPAYYTGNAHKWLCAPKGTAFLYVRPDRQHVIKPLIHSHRYDAPIEKRRQWSSTFFWSGTMDCTGPLTVPFVLKWLTTLMGSHQRLMDYNRQLCRQATELLVQRLRCPAPCPPDLHSCMASLPLGSCAQPPYTFNYQHPLQKALWDRYRIEVPVFVWPHDNPFLWVRISAFCYNSLDQYVFLADALDDLQQQGHFVR